MEIETIDGLLLFKGPKQDYEHLIYDFSLLQYLRFDRLTMTFGVKHHMGCRRRIKACLRTKTADPTYYVLNTCRQSMLTGTGIDNLFVDKVQERKRLLWLPIPFFSEQYDTPIPQHISQAVLTRTHHIIEMAKERYGTHVFSDGLSALEY